MGKVLVYGALIVVCLGIGLLIGGLSVHYSKPYYDQQTTRNAICIPRAHKASDSDVGGIILLSEIKGMPLKFIADIQGLPTYNLGFHIHTYGVVDYDCSSAGGHYNPKNATHGGPSSEERHIGDLGNIDATAFNHGTIKIEDSVATLFGEYSVLGRSIVIHENEDDLRNQSSAGPRLACCTIQRGINTA